MSSALDTSPVRFGGGSDLKVQAIVDHHHADVKTTSKVRFAEPGATEPEGPTANDAPSPPLADSDEKDNQDKVNTVSL
ncbi:unnamed protein product [Arctia plantaginis]|uniref:Uncharacterized protein n=1 Tax=Arctia plantaginis TaxID=874455 RepID=A0A8S1B9G4_ARCPL|nr:unnamed protein product [Arctia plantaginis]CAB3255507.1 unnamed protein product [Arctia plantaginis]